MADDELRLRLGLENLQYKKAWADVRVDTARQMAAIKTTVATSLNQARQSAAQSLSGIRTTAATQLGQTRVEVARQLSQIKTQTARDLAEIRRNTQRTLSGIGSDISGFGSQMKSVGAALTVGLTAPLAALAAVSTRSALQLDTFRNKLTAIEGGAEAAERRITRLRSLSQDSVGVTTRGALEAYSQLSAIGGITEKAIEQQIKAVGRLNAAFNIEDQQGFFRNLTQIFSQGFERSDIKEAIGRVPIFEQLLQQAFGTTDGPKLKKLKESGKLTLDAFLSGLSEAVESDPRLAGIGESLSVRLQKNLERVQFALAPIGESILKAIEPFVEPTARLIERLGAAFASLPDSAKLTIVVLAGIAAAVGPAIVVLGALVGAIGAIVTVVGAVGAPVLAGIAVIVAGVVAGAAALAIAWQTNFGGIQEITRDALSVVTSFVREHISTLVGWWQANLPLIRQTVQTVLNGIREFWAAHGAQITVVAKAAWENIQTIVRTVTNIVLGIIRLTMQVINEDWRGAWETVKGILSTALRGIQSLLSNLPSIVLGVLRTVIGIVIRAGAEIHDRALAVGFEIGQAIVQSILRGIASVNPQAAIALALITAISGAGAEATKAAAASGQQAGQAFASSFSQWGAVDGPWGEQEKPKVVGLGGAGKAAGGGGKGKSAQSEAQKEAERQAGVVKNLADEYARLASEVEHFSDEQVEQQIATARLNSGVETLTGAYRKQAELLLGINAQQMRLLESKQRIKEAQERAKKDEEELADLRANASDKVRDALNEQYRLLVGQETQLERVNKVILEAEVRGAIDARTAAWLRQLAVINDIAEQMQNVGPPVGLTQDIPQRPGQEKGPVVTEDVGPPPAAAWFEPMRVAWEQFKASIADLTPVQIFADSLAGLFTNLRGSILGSVDAIIFSGKSIKAALAAAFKDALAQTAAFLAKKAFMKALEALAEAAMHFAAMDFAGGARYLAAAAAWGALGAGVSALGNLAAGRGGAGALADSASSGSGVTSRESERDRTIREGRTGGASDPNAIAQHQVPFGDLTLKIDMGDGALEEKTLRIFNSNGRLRATLRHDFLGEAPSY